MKIIFLILFIGYNSCFGATNISTGNEIVITFIERIILLIKDKPEFEDNDIEELEKLKDQCKINENSCNLTEVFRRADCLSAKNNLFVLSH